MQGPKYLSELPKGRCFSPITVRVIRKWTHHDSSGQGVPLYVGMVLADAQGHAMYAEIADDLIGEKACLFDVGKVYVLKKFVVNNAKKSYRAVDRNLLINISQHTTVQVVPNPPSSIPEYIYRITPLPAIKPVRFVYNYTDTIGYLIKYKAAHTFVPKNKEKAKTLREIYIKDLSDNVMQVTLWGDQATGFNISDIYDREAGNLIVCLIVGCYPREDLMNNNKPCLSGSPACSCYLNPNIPEEPGPFKCAVTVVCITNTSSWWYMACRPCKKKADQQIDGSYSCPKCGGYNTAPRYLLHFIGKDDTSEASFLAYDDEAYQMIQKECEAVVNPLHKREGLPQQLQSIMNKTYILSVDLTDESCQTTKIREYQVKAVLERPSKRPSTHRTTAAYHDPQGPGSSTALIATPPSHSEVLQIEYPAQSTPVPASQTDHDAPKDDRSRSTTKHSVARRRLLREGSSPIKHTAGGDDEPENTQPSDTDTEDTTPLEPCPKKAKSDTQTDDATASQE
nr:conserved hypothetical protein [Saccharum hybrid cultivar]